MEAVFGPKRRAPRWSLWLVLLVAAITLTGPLKARAETTATSSPSLTPLPPSAVRAPIEGAREDEVTARTRLLDARIELARAKSAPEMAKSHFDATAEEAAIGLSAAERVDDPVFRTEVLGRLIESMIAADRVDDPALIQYIDRIRRADDDVPGAEAYALGLTAQIQLLRQDKAAAARSLETAILLESRKANPVRLADWMLLLARADPARRLEHIRAAFLSLERIRPLLPNRDPYTGETNFSLHLRPVYEAAADAELDPKVFDANAEAIEQVRYVVEAYRQAELSSDYGSECLPNAPLIQPSELNPGEIILYPIVLQDRVELITIDRARGYRRRPKHWVDRVDLANWAKTLRSVSSRPASKDQIDPKWADASTKLYEALIRPIEGDLNPNTTLIILPQGPLQDLPFAALTDCAQPRMAGCTRPFLVQKTSLAIAPALSFVQPGHGASKPRPVVVAAFSIDSGPIASSTGTPGPIEQEARDAVKAVGEPEKAPFLLSGYTKDQLQASLKRLHVDILHLSTHADFTGRAEESAISANGGKISIADLRALIRTYRARGDDLDLLILSACVTGLGDDQVSMGLGGAAVQAGAHSVLASLWAVRSAETADLMAAFYGAYLKGGNGKAKALQAAQLDLIRSGNIAPYYWAGFSLIGSWR